MGFNVGGITKGIFGSSAKQGKTNPSTVWDKQSPFLTANYQRGQNLSGQQMMAGSDFQNQNAALVGAWQDQLKGAQNPYLTGMATSAMNQISRQFQEQIMPSLLGGGNEAGQLGGERYGMLQGQAARDAAIGMGEVANNVYGNMANLGIQAQSDAIGQGSQVTGNAFNPLRNQAALLGSPTVLSGGGTTGTAASGGLLGNISGSFKI